MGKFGFDLCGVRVLLCYRRRWIPALGGIERIRRQFRILQVLAWWSDLTSWRVGIGRHGRRVLGGDPRGQIADRTLVPGDGVRGGARVQGLLGCQ